MKKRFLLLGCVLAFVACTPGTQPVKPLIPSGTTPTTPTQPSQPEQPAPLATQVYVKDASAITTASAQIECSYTKAPSEGVRDRGVYYGTSKNALTQQVALSSSPATDGSFTVTLTELEPETVYYYKAFVTVLDAAQKKYVDVESEVKSFRTESPVIGTSILGYHLGYEVPAIDFKEGEAWVSGQETPARNYGGEFIGENQDNVWFKSYTTNEKQAVVTHTFQKDGKRVRNWTGLIDKDKQGPLWIAFVMNKDVFPKTGIGRYDTWTPDPAVPSDWQRSVASSQYSRGHFVASDYRQNSVDANAQTFYYTNQTLQWQNGFNSGVWSSLEGAVSSNAPSGSDSLYVVVGVLYEGQEKIIDTNQGVKASVASHFYKCLMKCSFNSSGTMTAAKGCAYLFTNEDQSGSYAKGITSIDAIEQRSGWDFFANVPKDLQDAAESSSTALW